MAYLPRHLCRHESLTAAESDYLISLDLPSRTSVQLFTALTEAVLASRVDFFSSDPGAPHWKTAALTIYPAIAREGEDGLTAATVKAGADWLRNDCQKPDRALALLMKVERLKKEWRLEQVKRFVTTADKLPARTSDRAAQQQYAAASLDCQQQTGHSYTDLYTLK